MGSSGRLWHRPGNMDSYLRCLVLFPGHMALFSMFLTSSNLTTVPYGWGFLELGPMFCGTLTLIHRNCGTLTLPKDPTVTVWLKSITIFTQESLLRFSQPANYPVHVVLFSWGCNLCRPPPRAPSRAQSGIIETFT